MKSLKNNIKTKIGYLSIRLCIFMYDFKTKNGPIGRLLFSCYQSILKIVNISTFPIVDAESYKDKSDVFYTESIEKKRIGVQGHIVLAGENLDTNLKNNMIQKDLPDLNLELFKDVCISGNSDIVVDIKNNCVISDTSYNIDDNEEVVDGLLYRTRQNVCLLRNNMKNIDQHISSGIMISGKFCYNYYHIIFENLIKLLYIDKLNISNDIPIIVDKKTIDIPSCRKILNILLHGNTRDIITIESNRIYHFDNLYYISNVNLFPGHILNTNKWNGNYLYYPKAIKELKNRLLEYKSDKKFPEKIFISRAKMKSRQFNEDEVFSILKKFGFEKVFPELLSFEDQMALFSSVKYIVAGSGAALSNLLFLNDYCNVICFGIGNESNTKEIPVFNTIANINDAKFIFFPRHSSETKGGIHSNFTIDCGKLDTFISSYLD